MNGEPLGALSSCKTDDVGAGLLQPSEHDMKPAVHPGHIVGCDLHAWFLSREHILVIHHGLSSYTNQARERYQRSNISSLTARLLCGNETQSRTFRPALSAPKLRRIIEVPTTPFDWTAPLRHGGLAMNGLEWVESGR